MPSVKIRGGMREVQDRRFEVIAVGNELLIGKTLNTNLYWIASEITKLGGFVRRATVVRDDLDEISAAVREAMQRKAKWIIITGGLGPTFDDMTMQGVARALHRELVLNQKGLEYLKQSYERFRAQGILMSYGLTEERKKMVMLPARSKALPNSVGTAPGILTKADGSVIICLPGVPAEMQAMMQESVIPEITRTMDTQYFCEGVLQVSRIIESTLAPFIKKVMASNPNAYVKSHPKGLVEGASRIELSITTTASDKKIAQEIVRKTLEEIGEYIIKLGGVILSRWISS